ncbi:PD-(D/E)XK nuclease family protein [Thermomicrobium sp. 4228-Ro]|uniref:CRISPR-associated protein Cas4 n=1 Tax=Thermomicrobium sp. 4228-Ro TaxID=2993937 RepID=UPI0022497FC0|nr:PD-(D/E)XK nuclease family protein [Thermomicrobium sp. 4228-Ro]MCX2726028.1 PD-(D/E)XK nuclease family protein [Thermomicrobium sp. 4228-Ro]
MPAVGWWLGEGELVPFEEAREVAAREGMFEGWILPVLVAMEEQAKQERGLWVSPSQALVCPRLRVLQLAEPYYVKPEWVWAAMNGSAIHRRIAEVGVGALEGYLHELPLAATVRVSVGIGEVDFPVQGTADLYIPGEARLIDVKTTSKRVQASSAEHELQVNIYAWLLRENGYPVERAELWYAQPGLRNGRVQRQLVPVELLPQEEVTELLVAIAEPLARYVEEGVLPDCRCVQRPFVYPDLCNRFP